MGNVLPECCMPIQKALRKRRGLPYEEHLNQTDLQTQDSKEKDEEKSHNPQAGHDSGGSGGPSEGANKVFTFSEEKVGVHYDHFSPQDPNQPQNPKTMPETTETQVSYSPNPTLSPENVEVKPAFRWDEDLVEAGNEEFRGFRALFNSDYEFYENGVVLPMRLKAVPYGFAEECISDLKRNLAEPIPGVFENIHQGKGKELYELQLWFRSYNNSEGHRVTVVRGDWFVPCSAEQYINFMSDLSEQRKVDDQIEKYYAIAGDDDFNQVLYLSYKKMLITSPRDFIYFKGIKKEEDNVYIDVGRSMGLGYIDHHDPKKVLGHILLSGHIVSDLPPDQQTPDRRASVQLYSEVDLRINIPAFIAKKFVSSSTRHYIERCIAHLAALYKVA